MKDERPHVVVVEDEAFQREMLETYLGRNGYRVTGLINGPALRRLLERETPELVLLDVNLPGGEDGFSLARTLRERNPRIGIIMVTASGDTVDRVVGLETGADDYIAKPFDSRELLARVKSVLRRTTAAVIASPGPRVRMGRAVLDLERRLLIDAEGKEDRLTASEFDLLRVFVEHPNRPLTRDWLLETTSHREMEAFDRSIDLRVTRIRRKIEHDPAHPDAIRTVRGTGYMFVPTKD
jgi:DNA-binding response OmpR family regulator